MLQLGNSLFEVGGQVSTCGGGLLSNCIGQRFSAIVAVCGGFSIVALGSVCLQSLWDAGPLVHMWYAGSSLVVAPGQHTNGGQGLSLVALY